MQTKGNNMSTALPTAEEVELMTSSQLVARYNDLALAANLRPVKKFETRPVGIKRLTEVAAALRARVASAGEMRKGVVTDVVVPKPGELVEEAAPPVEALAKTSEVKSLKYWASAVSNCDLCGKPIDKHMVDGGTRSGQWGLMCVPCHNKHGLGLGTGHGQMYDKQTDGRWLKVTGPSRKDKAQMKAPKPNGHAAGAELSATLKAPKVTFASRCRALILEGKTNAEEWAVLAPEFGYDEKTAVQRTHAGWHRADMKRKGGV